MSAGGWPECAPRQARMRETGVERAARLMRAANVTAQLCVLRHGQVVLDRQHCCTPRALFPLLSASKPFVAVQVHLLAERGALSLDDPVAAYWPRYARNGKGQITIRHVLTHRAGVPFASGSELGDALTMARPGRATRQAQRARPRWRAGQEVAYHPMTFGFILGEVVRRVTGRPVADQLAADILGPLGLHDTHLGLPDSDWDRRVPLTAGSPRDRAQAWAFNRRRVRQAVIPATGVSTTARDLARFYQMLLNGGHLDGVRIMSPAAVAEATRPSSGGQRDRVQGRPAAWAHGFALARPGEQTPMGRLASPRTFGHAGAGGSCVAWADPACGVVLVHLTNRLVTSSDLGARHQCEVSDTIRAACE